MRDGRDDLERKEALLSNHKVQKNLKIITAQQEKVEHSMETLKKKYVEQAKMTEVALLEDRNLNEGRKKK